MTDKFHTLKTWDGKDYSRIRTKEYISVSAVQEWIDSMKTETPLSRDAIRDNELLEELETFIHDKK